jgi:hypothetical protein
VCNIKKTWVEVVAVRGGILASTRAGQNFSVSPSTPGEVDESEHGLLYGSTSTLYLLAYFTCTSTFDTFSMVPVYFLLPFQPSRCPYTHSQQKSPLISRATPDSEVKGPPSSPSISARQSNKKAFLFFLQRGGACSAIKYSEKIIEQMLGLHREKVTRDWRQVHEEKLHDLYRLSDIICVIK